MRAAWIAALLALGVPAGAEELRLDGHGGPVQDIAVLSDGRVATASFDNSVGLWQGAAPTWLDGHSAAVNVVVARPDGSLVSGGDDFEVRHWAANPGSSEVIGRHRGKVMDLADHPKAALIASAGWDGAVGLWPLDGGEGATLSAHEGAVNAVVFDPTGARLYSAAADGQILVWDVPTRTLAGVVHRHGFGVNELVLGPAGDWLAYGAVDGGTRIIDPGTGAEIGDFSAGRRPILAMAATADGRRLAVGDGEGYILVLAQDGGTWSVLADVKAAARGPVWALAWSPDGDTLYAAGIGAKAYGWSVDALSTAEGRLGAAEPSFLKDPGAMSNGERQFARKCSVCHTLTGSGDRRAGPPLAGLFGRRAGSIDGYPYSPVLRDADIVWSDETIDQLFDLGPDHYIPGSKMPMQRITTPEDRADLIAYLKTATAPGRSAQ